MAQKRMFNLKIVDTDEFLDMPPTTQNLYFHLGMRADDDGFVSNPKKIMKIVNSADDDMKVLVGKSFVIPFDSGICVIKHWKIHNLIRSDRYIETEYKKEKELLIEEDKKYKLNNGIQNDIPNGNPVKVRLDKIRLDKVSVSKDNIVGKADDPLSSVKKEQITKEKQILKDISKYTEKDLKLAELLYNLIKKENPSWYVSPQWDVWSNDIRKIREIDNRTYDQIEYIIKWSQDDDFWHKNVLSPSKLRKQFNRLVVEAKSDNKKRKKIGIAM